MLEGVGITQPECAMVLSNTLVKQGWGRSSALKQAWQTTRKLWEAGDVAENRAGMLLIDDLGICPDCLEGGWLMVVSRSCAKCQNCGLEFFVFEGPGGVRL